MYTSFKWFKKPIANQSGQNLHRFTIFRFAKLQLDIQMYPLGCDLFTGLLSGKAIVWFSQVTSKDPKMYCRLKCFFRSTASEIIPNGTVSDKPKVALDENWEESLNVRSISSNQPWPQNQVMDRTQM